MNREKTIPMEPPDISQPQSEIPWTELDVCKISIGPNEVLAVIPHILSAIDTPMRISELQRAIANWLESYGLPDRVVVLPAGTTLTKFDIPIEGRDEHVPEPRNASTSS